MPAGRTRHHASCEDDGMAHGTHDYDIDPRNVDIIIGINDDLLPR
ncbi:MAG: hypothetical protein ACJASK_000754, partial [Ilumatobacter sp.]